MGPGSVSEASGDTVSREARAIVSIWQPNEKLVYDLFQMPQLKRVMTISDAMPRFAFIVLAHKDPNGLIRTIRALVSRGDCVALHYDKRAPASEFRALREALGNEPRVVFARRTKCGWGEWSLVQGTLNGIDAAIKSFPDASHFYLMSGDCVPTKSRAYMARFIEDNDRDYIEHHDFHKSDWIKTGLKEDRLYYRHWFNERKHKTVFYASLQLQRRLGLDRDVPKGIRPLIGSQWFLLRRATIERIRDLIRKRPDLVSFFKTTWIPDETFFQTLVLHVTPRHEVENRSPTFKAFSDYGMPLVFHDDHAELLQAENCLFARKMSERATELRAQMIELFKDPHDRLETSESIAALHQYLTSKGRTGHRHVPRFWETGARIGRGREIIAIVCKKWHVGKRVASVLDQVGGVRGFGYVFDEDDCDLPDLGGIESSREKRGRHRRSFMSLLFEVTGKTRLAICLDPSQTEAIQDLRGDDCKFTVIQVDTEIPPEYLIGHAQRIGLINGHHGGGIEQLVVESLAREFSEERERLVALVGGDMAAIGHANGLDESTWKLAEISGGSREAIQQELGQPGFFD